MQIFAALVVAAFVVASYAEASIVSSGNNNRAAVAGAVSGRRPVVLLHGLFANKEAMSHVEGWLTADFPGIYVYNAEIPSENATDAHLLSLLIPMERQVQMFAAQVQADPQLANGFDLVCHSQGGLTCRAFIEKYNTPRVHNFISLAGPQMGVFGVPVVNALCPDASCPELANWMTEVAYNWDNAFFQHNISFAQYWRSPLAYSLYLNVSGYLADVNNERAVKNPTYRENMIAVSGNITLVMALEDDIVVPRQSAWFDFFAIGQDKLIQNMTESPGYIGDWIGLRTLNEAGRLARVAAECSHQNLPRQECKSQVYDAIIKPRVGGML